MSGGKSACEYLKRVREELERRGLGGAALFHVKRAMELLGCPGAGGAVPPSREKELLRRGVLVE